MSAPGPEGLDVFAACVAQNATDAANLHNKIQEGLARDRMQMAAWFASLFDALEDIPDMTRTVHVDQLLTTFASARHQAMLWGAV